MENEIIKTGKASSTEKRDGSLSKKIKDFQDLLTRFTNDHADTVYRGVSDQCYQLVSKFDRLCGSKGNQGTCASVHCKRSEETKRECEKKLLTKFRTRAASFVRHPPRNDWEWLSLAQHHGLPTRLLDWTDNPLVAAYFAVKDQNADKVDGAIYSLKGQGEYVNIEAHPQPFTSDISAGKRLLPVHVTNRIVAQAGLFTIASIYEGDGFELDKMVIPAAEKRNIRRSLNEYGINEFSLFPDLDSISKHLQWYSECYPDYQ